MSLRRSILKGAAVLIAGQVAGQTLAFARNIIIARMLSPHDVGIAATLAITLSLIELVADVSIDKLLIQAKDGDDPRLQASCQAALAVRGVAQGVVLFVLAWPAARLFDLPDLVWAFQIIAIGPVIRGFAHADVGRVQRHLRFTPAAISELIPQAAALGAVIPMAIWFADFRAVLFATLLQAGLYTACTHVFRERAYRWSWDGAAFRRIATFGWPLMLNGALLFAIAQGDRIAIGAGYTKEELALWANAMLLASAPLLVLGKVAVSVALPVLSRCRDDRAAFDRHYQFCMQGLAWVGAVVAVPLVLGGGPIMALIFGEPYAAAGAFVGILAVAQAVRACRLGINAAAMAHGRTGSPAQMNVARLIGVAAACWFAVALEPMWMIAAAGLAGEVLAWLVGAWRLASASIVAVPISVAHILPATAAVCCASLLHTSISDSRAVGISGSIGAGVFVGIIVAIMSSRLRRESVHVLNLCRFAVGVSRS